MMELVDKGDPVLRVVCDSVVDVANEVRPVLQEMRELMRKKRGMGLAAPQVGIRLRFFISKIKGVGVAVNPGYYPRTQSIMIKNPEGCLTFPGQSISKVRHSEIRISYESKYGKQCVGVLRGREARIFQHECDHLNGICLF